MMAVIPILCIALGFLSIRAARDNDWHMGRVCVGLGFAMLLFSLLLEQYVMTGVTACFIIGYWASWREDGGR